MRTETQRALTALNRRFYEENADAFSRTRQSPWEGWARILARGAARSVLDVGCGNGRFARLIGDDVDYFGCDTSAALVAEVPRPNVVVADFFDRPWGAKRFDLVVAFGVLHHVAGRQQRQEAIRILADALTDDGQLVVTVWQFIEVLGHRVLPWTAVPEVDPTDLDEGDHLLSFASEVAPRYCHAADDEEIERWRTTAKLTTEDDFYADGRNNRMNRYLVWSSDRT